MREIRERLNWWWDPLVSIEGISFGRFWQANSY